MSDADQRMTKRSQTIPLRPLKGIYRDVSSTLIPTGGFHDVEGYLPADSGLIRRSGFSPIAQTSPVIIRWNYINSFIDDDGVKITFGIGDGKFYEIAGDGFTERPNTYEVGTITVTTGLRTVTGTGTDWESLGGLVLGDKITTPLGNVYTIDTVADDETITILEIPTVTETDVTYEAKRIMTPAADWVIQVVRLDRNLYIVTGKNTVMIYNLDSADRVRTWWEQANTTPDTPNFIPKCIWTFKDRVWTGNIFSDKIGRWFPTRMSWTPILDALSFMPDDHFQELVTIGGEISCVRGLGNLLMVYFEFGVQFGRETQIPGDTLPLGFDIAETGSRGVIQPDAVTTAMGGHFFVSTDNVYYISQNMQTAAIAENVKELMFSTGVNKARYKIMNFYEGEGLAVASSSREDSYETIWIYNTTTKEWTKFGVSSDYVNVFALGSRSTYADFDPGQIYGADPNTPCGPSNWQEPDWTTRDVTTQYFNQYDVSTITGTDMSNGWADIGADPTPPVGPYTPYTTVPLYGVIQPGETAPGSEANSHTFTEYTSCLEIYGGSSNVSAAEKFFLTSGRFIYVYDRDSSEDQDGTPVESYFETGDFDLGMPDTYKAYYQLALRLDERAPSRLDYNIQASDDSGLTWYAMGTLVVYAGGKEGRCNFLHTGSATRFRVTSTSEVTSYLMTEVTLYLRLRGRQFGDF